MTGPDVLGTLGWDDRLEQLGRAAAASLADTVPGRVARVDKGIVSVATAAGPVRAAVGADALAAGDWVLLGPGPAVVALLPRRSAFVRGDPMDGSARAAQVVAANIDVVFVTQSVERRVNLRRLERELVLAFESGATPVVVLTKADVAADAAAEAVAARRSAPGVPVIVTSAVTGEGVDEVRARLGPGVTGALIGASGVGKSTLVNRLLGDDVRETGPVRATDRRGRHTTTARELVLLPGGGLLVDTPGLRAVTLWWGDDGLRREFADIEALAPACRFDDCAHDREPGCAVQEAVARGDIDADRVSHYRELDAELDAVARRRRERAASGRHARRAGSTGTGG